MMVRNNRKSRNHGSRDFRDFYQMPRFCWFHQIIQYLLSINCNLRCDFSTKLILSINSVASCTTVPKFTHFSYFQVPWWNCCLHAGRQSGKSMKMCNHWHFGFLVAISFQSFSNLQFNTCPSLAILSMLSGSWVNIH